MGNNLREKLQDFREILIATFLIGLVAHGFCYLNIFFGHDASGLWWSSDIIGGATGGRFLQPLLSMFLYDVRVPWLDGVLTLLFYAIAIWTTCMTLQISNRVLKYLVVGVFITSPTAIASNHYNGYIFAFALMTACLAVYVFVYIRWGKLLGFVLIFMTASVYASYVSVTVVIFLLYSIRQVLINRDRYFFRQVQMAIITFVAMISVLWLSMKIAEVNHVGVQARVESAAEMDMVGVFDLVREAIVEVIIFFSPKSEISFFQGMPLVYYSFWVLFFCSVTGIAYLIIYRFEQEKKINEVYKKVVINFITEIIIVLIDLLCLPIAMNMLAIVTTCHYLMKFSFIAPWLMAILVLDMLIEIHGNQKEWLIQGYKVVIVVACVITVFEGIKLANISYTKQYSNYETGIQYANRVVSRIESIEGYIPGKTKVLFLGFDMNTYSIEDSEYRIVKDLTGISDNTALTYSIPLFYYIQQRLGVDMNIINEKEDYFFSMDACISTLEARNVYFDAEEIYRMNSFPQNNCYLWADDILVFKLGSSDEFDIMYNDKVVMECWPEHGDYELIDTIQYYLDLPLGVSRIVMDVTNGDNFDLDVLDSDDVQNVRITRRDDTQIYIDILCSQDTNITFQVGLVSQEKNTTIHRIAIRPISNFYEIPVSSQSTVELNEGRYLFTIAGEDMHDVKIKWSGKNISIDNVTDGEEHKQYLVIVPEKQMVTYSIKAGELKISKISYKRDEAN